MSGGDAGMGAVALSVALLAKGKRGDAIDGSVGNWKGR